MDIKKLLSEILKRTPIKEKVKLKKRTLINKNKK